MQCKLFVFRHAETTDNARQIFSGWRDPRLTPKGHAQARQTADQLKHETIHYAFTSHLQRARHPLAVVLIERCYGRLQGKSKRRIAQARPHWYAKVHRGYDFPPPAGESLKMVLNRTLPFLNELQQWLPANPGNVAVSCHGNSMRPIRKVFEHLSIQQMLQLENPQDQAMTYTLNYHQAHPKAPADPPTKGMWKGIHVPRTVKLATDPKNPLTQYY
jgi:2,3-bisphosphoglycerate-dependent phosphoglycerate mutase